MSTAQQEDLQQKEQQQLSTESRPQSAESRRFATPLVDIESTQDGYVLYAEMPGVSKDGIEVTVENGDLLIVGHRRPLEVSGEPIYRESRPYDFRRVYELDPSIDTSRISARIENGLLIVNLPKAEKVKPRRIEVE
ncbi:MAG TPA: Hsp20/alpha crystallin family protein [Chthoniobacterales bacterium]|jgi:HSP20 family protein|nr:Hsp20/alpha crystallin family protein [Chthoniobacterales bacterium]